MCRGIIYFPTVIPTNPLAFLIALCQYIDMVCIYCKNPTSVTNSRANNRDVAVWRRRLCSVCGAILTSFEHYELSTAFIVKKRSGALEAFQRDKLLISIARAIDHRKNPAQAASDLTKTILNQLLKPTDLSKTLSTADISRVTSLALKRYDAASSIRYLSFQSPTHMPRDIKKMLK